MLQIGCRGGKSLASTCSQLLRVDNNPDILFVNFEHICSLMRVLCAFLSFVYRHLTDGVAAYRPDIPRPRPGGRCFSRRSRNPSPYRNKPDCPCPCPWSPGR